MKIAKPLLLVSTPLGIIGGLHEAYRLAGGLVILMATFMAFMCAAFGMVVRTIRREQAAERARRPAIESHTEAAG